jgi:hypothetical protein
MAALYLHGVGRVLQHVVLGGVLAILHLLDLLADAVVCHEKKEEVV